jgi:hypothetical protein
MWLSGLFVLMFSTLMRYSKCCISCWRISARAPKKAAQWPVSLAGIDAQVLASIGIFLPVVFTCLALHWFRSYSQRLLNGV